MGKYKNNYGPREEHRKTRANVDASSYLMRALASRTHTAKVPSPATFEDSADKRTGALFHPRSGTMHERLGRHGKPLLLPRPTLAAHNGRMLVEYERACKSNEGGIGGNEAFSSRGAGI